MKTRANVLRAAIALMLACPVVAAPAATMAQQNRLIFLPSVLRLSPPPPTVFGIGVNVASTSGGLTQLKASNSSWTRLPGLDWELVEPNEGDRNWAAVADLEQQLRDLAANNITVSLIIRMAPRWAHRVPGQYCGPVKPEKYSAMANFVRDAVARYSVAPYNVKYWEFWNEPDAPYAKNSTEDNRSGFGCWGDDAQPFYNGREYGDAFKVAYQAAKQANGQVQFLIGGLLMDCDPAFKPGCLAGNFFEGVLQSTGANFDGVSFHAYDYVIEQNIGAYTQNDGWDSNSGWDGKRSSVGPGLIAKGRFLRRKMAEAGISGKVLMNTETGIVRFGAADAPCSDTVCNGTKVAYVPQSYAAAIAEGLIANMWYWLYGWWGSGLVYGNGQETEAYKAYVFARQMLGYAKFVGDVSTTDVGATSNVMGYKFTNDGKTVWVVWSFDRVQRSLSFATAPDNIYDPLGTALPTTNVTVGYMPIYVVWNP